MEQIMSDLYAYCVIALIVTASWIVNHWALSLVLLVLGWFEWRIRPVLKRR
jgi:hypothetical protein